MSCRYALGAFLILCFMLMPERIPAQAPNRPDNLMLLQTLCDRVAEQIVKQLLQEPGATVFLPAVEDAASSAALLRGRIVKRALDAGHRVFAMDSSLAAQNYLQLEGQSLACGVEYDVVRSGGLWRRSTVRRRAAVEVDVEVTEHPSGQVRRRETFKAEVADTVRASEISRLENPDMPFTIGNQPRQSVWPRIIEPLVLTVAAGAAVYALYSLRSQ